MIWQFFTIFYDLFIYQPLSTVFVESCGKTSIEETLILTYYKSTLGLTWHRSSFKSFVYVTLSYVTVSHGFMRGNFQKNLRKPNLPSNIQCKHYCATKNKWICEFCTFFHSFYRPPANIFIFPRGLQIVLIAPQWKLNNRALSTFSYFTWGIIVEW